MVQFFFAFTSATNNTVHLNQGACSNNISAVLQVTDGQLLYRDSVHLYDAWHINM